MLMPLTPQFVLGLIVIDVICVICEVLVVITKCPCTGFGNHGRRQLGGGGDNDGTCVEGEYEFSHEQHSAEVVLHYISVTILLGASEAFVRLSVQTFSVFVQYGILSFDSRTRTRTRRKVEPCTTLTNGSSSFSHYPHDIDTSRCSSVRGTDIYADSDLRESLLYQRILRVGFGENRSMSSTRLSLRTSLP